MRKLIKLNNRNPDEPEYLFWCPACENYHWFKTSGPGPIWQWNGSLDKPTISPDIVGVIEMKGDLVTKSCRVRVTDGVIEYLQGSYHERAGTRAEMVEV